MKKILLFLLFTIFCNAQKTDYPAVESALNQWHKAAADAKFDTYFGLMTETSVFIGTDHTERWGKKAFMDYARPHFDKGRAWAFTAFSREITGYTADLVWFDELLDTQMGICRGSGLMKKENGQWKVERYVLSMSVPNDNTEAVIKIKAPIEDAFMKENKFR